MAFGYRPGGEMGDRIGAVVCDGISTVHLPDLASRMAAVVALEALLTQDPADESMRSAVAAAGAAVTDLSPDRGPDAPSCTMVAALADRTVSQEDTHPQVDRTGHRITVGWVGDARAYWVPTDHPNTEGDALEYANSGHLLTTDHSWATEMVRSGLLDEATASADPRMHAITRWIGAGDTGEPELVTFEPDRPGALVLCTDGLWNYLPEPADLTAVAAPALRSGGAAAAVAALTAFALAAGGGDNITVVCIALDDGRVRVPEACMHSRRTRRPSVPQPTDRQSGGTP